MAGKSIGNVYAELSVRDKMTTGLKRATQSLKKFGASSARIAGGGLAAGIAASSAALLVGTKRSIGMVDALGDLSAQTGVSVSSLMKLQRAYSDGGREASMASKDIGRMQKSIFEVASGKVKDDPFESLGLNAEKLAQLSPEQQFQQIGDAIMKISNPLERNARAMQIFGKSGMGLVTVFGKAEASIKSLGRMPELAEKFAAEMDEANDIMGRLPVKSDQFFLGFTTGIINDLLPALRKVDEQDFTTLGESLGKAVSFGFKGIMDGSLLESMALKITAWAVDAGGYIVAAFEAAFATISDKFSNILADLAGGIAMMTGDETQLAMHDQDILSRGKQKGFAQRFAENKSANAQVSTPLKAMADELWNKNKIQDSVGEAIVGTMRKAGEDVMYQPIAKEEQSKKEMRDWEATSLQVNDLQSRGLSYGNADVPNVVKEQANTIKMLYDVMRKAVEKGDIIFTGA